jgi:predicted CXXCH cytochrome family protein
LILLLLMLPVFAADTREATMPLKTSQSNNHKQFLNPHWQANGCASCHDGKPTRKNLKLHTTDINTLCNSCHESVSQHSYIHPFGMKPSKKIMKNMPRAFLQAVKRGKGKLTCITCHDLPLTCLDKNKSKQGLNPLFFREGPYKTRTELCYRCHDKTKYQRLNPHDQISKSGELNTKLCTVCHKSVDKLKNAKSIDDVDFNHEGDLSSMCAGCHPVKPHPGGSFAFFSDKKGPDHLVVPSERIIKQKTTMEQKNNIVLPLEPGTGKVFCGTCHNPHEKGVIKMEAAAKGADAKKRLRMQKICRNCHDK